MRIVQKLGFQFVRQTGSHAHYRHEDGRWATIPMHVGDIVGSLENAQQFKQQAPVPVQILCIES